MGWRCEAIAKDGARCDGCPASYEDRFCGRHDPQTYLARIEQAIQANHDAWPEVEEEFEQRRAKLQRAYDRKKNAHLKQLRRLDATRNWCKRLVAKRQRPQP